MSQKKASYSWLPRNFDGVSLKTLKIRVSGRLYARCVESSQNYAANLKPGTYGQGLARTTNDPYRPVRTGLLGESAFAMATGSRVDFSFRPKGDESDFKMSNGLTLDVKCSVSPEREVGLIRVRNELGEDIPLDKDIYVFSYVETENQVEGFADVVLAGWLPRQHILVCAPIAQGRKRDPERGHINREVSYRSLRPIRELLECWMAPHKLDLTPPDLVEVNVDELLVESVCSSEEEELELVSSLLRPSDSEQDEGELVDELLTATQEASNLFDQSVIEDLLDPGESDLWTT